MSVFSPYYALARRRGTADPEHHCALNVALYGEGGKRWSLTERGRNDLRRDAASFAVGPSALRWDGGTLTVAIDEVTVPLPSRLRGTVRLTAPALTDFEVRLDPAGRHRWWPICPAARVEVRMERPALSWSGAAYFDTNSGDEPIEDGFSSWDWSRGALPGGGAAILYDAQPRQGPRRPVAARFDAQGRATPFEPAPRVPLPTTTVWRIRRGTQADAGAAAKVVRTLEDTPFYARSLVATTLGGQPLEMVHESLSLDRFRQPWVQILLPFRMPRRAR